MMLSLVCVAAAQQFFQPAMPGFPQTGLRGGLAPVEAPVVQVVRIPVTPAPATPASVSALAMIAGVVTGVAAAALSAGRAPRVVMKEDPLIVDALASPSSLSDPRLGNPFEEGGPRVAVEAYQPRGITDATVLKKQYIETEDEPWNCDARQTVTVSKAQIEQSLGASLPFVAPEENLIADLANAEKKDAVKSAIAKAKADGARAGSPAVAAGEKLLKAFEEGSEEDALKARPKAPKKAGAQGAGWDSMKRAVATLHDNSVA